MFEEFGRAELLDGWGYEYLYQSKGDSYILVGLGSDHEPDGIDNWALRESGKDLMSVSG